MLAAFEESDEKKAETKVKTEQLISSCHLFPFPSMYLHIPQCRKLKLHSHILCNLGLWMAISFHQWDPLWGSNGLEAIFLLWLLITTCKAFIKICLSVAWLRVLVTSISSWIEEADVTQQMVPIASSSSLHLSYSEPSDRLLTLFLRFKHLSPNIKSLLLKILRMVSFTTSNLERYTSTFEKTRTGKMVSFQIYGSQLQTQDRAKL